MERSVKQVLKARRQDLHLEDGTEVVLDAEHEAAASARHVATVSKFTDLQALSLVPEGISEKALSEAVARDDEEARNQAQRTLSARPQPCGCDEDASTAELRPLKLTHGADFRRTYAGIRKSYSPNVASVLAEAGRVDLEPSDLQVSVVKGWYSRLRLDGNFGLLLWLFRTVEIGRNATLALGPSEKGLYCGDLLIHIGGKLLIKGSGVKVRCLTARGDLP